MRSTISNTTTLKLRFLLRKNNRIIMPINSDGEMKNFLFHHGINSLKEIQNKDEFKNYLFEELRNGLYFNEFLIQLFREQYDIFIASIEFTLENKEYHFSDIFEDYFYWIEKEYPRITIAEKFSRIEMDIYQFDEYNRHIGIDKINYNYQI